MSNNIIEVKNLTKTYKIYGKPVDRLKEAMSISKKSYSREFNALYDVSFSVKKGENIGIIGTNGSGKSTLLKIITGVLSQSSGEVNVQGKISALLELGAGFNPEYTGIENIYLNGTMMGYSREEMDEKVNAILEFAGIGDFVHRPVKTYSSGMFARLAFAVAINVEPDILIVDEALSVGDAKFQTKCIEKMKYMMSGGTTVLFVSHAIEQVNRFCTRAIWIDKGVLKMDGEVASVTTEYENYMMYGEDAIQIPLESDQEGALNDELILPEDESIMASITNVKINKNEFYLFEALEIQIDYEIYVKDISNFLLGVAIFTPTREYIFGPNTFLEKVRIKSNYGKHRVCYKIPKLMLIKGVYNIDVGLFNNEGIVTIDYKADTEQFTVKNHYESEGILYMNHHWEVIK